MNTFRRTRLSIFIALIGLASGAGALAQTQPDGQPPAHPDAAPMGGPAVTERDVPGVAGRFGDAPDQAKRRMANRIPPRVMRGALGAIMGDDAPENLRATPEQREKIRAHMEEFQQQLRDYLQQHKAEIEDLRGKMPPGAMNGPGGEFFRRIDGAAADRAGERAEPGEPRRRERSGPGGEPAQGAGKARRAAAEIPVEVRDRMRELAAGMPPFEQVHTKIWAELRPEQREAVEERLNRFRERQSEMREDSYVQKRLGDKRGPGGPPGAGERPKGPPPADRGPQARRGPAPRDAAPRAGRPGPGADRRERLQRLLDRMTPEQQEQLLSRLEQRQREQGPDRSRVRDQRRGPGPEGDRPPRP